MEEKAVLYNMSEFGIHQDADCTPLINSVLELVKNRNHPATLIFEKGVYHFYKDNSRVREYHTSNTDSSHYPQKQIAILLEGMQNITMEGNDSLFIFHGDVMALAVVHSENIVLRNFAWDYDASTVSEMRVENMGEEDGKEFTDFVVPFGCPFTIEGSSLIWNGGTSPYTGEYYWQKKNDHNGWTLNGWMPGKDILRRYKTEYGPFVGCVQITSLENCASGRRVRIHYENCRPVLQQLGFVYEMLGTPIRETAGAFFWESKNLIAENINPHYLLSFGWLVQMCENVRFSRCRFAPKEDSGRLCTSYADSIHVSGASGFIIIENCTFTHSLDDAINIHGTYTRMQVQKEHCLTLCYIQEQQTGFPQYHVGDQIEILHRTTLMPLSNDQMEPITFTVLESTPPLVDGNNAQTMKVVLDKIPVCSSPLKEYVVENVSYTPFVRISGCDFSVIPTRGILCTTRNKTVIENNVFRNMTMCPIFLSNDSNEWYESGMIRDMEISHNKFYQTSPDIGRKETWAVSDQDGLTAIHIHPEVMGGRENLNEQNPIHHNICIKDNDFYLKTGVALIAESVDGLVFCNNHIYCYEENRNQEIEVIYKCKNYLSEENKLCIYLQK